MKTSILAVASAGALLFSAAPAVAQSVVTNPAPASSTKGFFIGLHLNGSGITADDLYSKSQSGGGTGLHLGYGFTPRLALFVEGTAAALDDDAGGEIGFGHFDLGVRYAWTGPTRRWVPSIEAALSGRALAQDDATLEDGLTHDVALTGAGFTFGGGIQYYFSPRVALGAHLKWTGGEFDKYTVDDESIDDLNIDATSTRLNIGLTWYPFTRR